jgi:hypothetical protein
MSPRRIAAGRSRAIRATLALLAGSACLGAVAYAATGGDGRVVAVAGGEVAKGAPRGGNKTHKRNERAPQVRLIEVPEATSSTADPQFRFHVPAQAQETSEAPSSGPAASRTPRRRFQCRLDAGGWSACSSPHRLAGLALGEHAFSVRALSREGRPGPDAEYTWVVAEAVEESSPGPVERTAGMPFSIEQAEPLEPLFPGEGAQQIPLRISNPNPVPIEVVALIAEGASAGPGCAPENFTLVPSNASPEAPLVVPAKSALELPSAGVSAPMVGMLDLPVNQDACQGAQVEVLLSGEARG